LHGLENKNKRTIFQDDPCKSAKSVAGTPLNPDFPCNSFGIRILQREL
jgi:hypothetical protein